MNRIWFGSGILFVCLVLAATARAETYVLVGEGPLEDGALKRKPLHMEELPNIRFKEGDELLLPCGAHFNGNYIFKSQLGGSGYVDIKTFPSNCGGNRPTFSGAREVHVHNNLFEVPQKKITKLLMTVAGGGLKEVLPATIPNDGFYYIQDDDVKSYKESSGKGIKLALAQASKLKLVGSILAVKTGDWLVERRSIVAQENGLVWINAPFRYEPQIEQKYIIYGGAALLGAAQYERELSWGWQIFPSDGVGLLSKALANASSAKKFMASNDAPVVRLEGNFRIADVKIENSGGNGLEINGEKAEVRNISIGSSLMDGVRLDVDTSALIDGLVIENSGHDGIYAKGSGVVSIKNSVITNTGMQGRLAQTVAAINVADIGKSIVEQNVIYQSGYSGIRVGRNADIKSNSIVQSCLTLDDCGAIYTWNRPLENVPEKINITGNLIDGVYGAPNEKIYGTNGRKMAVGVYLDYGSNGALIEHNLIRNTRLGVFAGNSYNNVISNNLIESYEDCAVCMGGSSDWMEKYDLLTNVVHSNQFGEHSKGSVPFKINQIESFQKAVSAAQPNSTEKKIGASGDELLRLAASVGVPYKLLLNSPGGVQK